MADKIREASKGADFTPGELWQCQCGQTHTFSAYAYAHWHVSLDHTCDACGTIRYFKRGKVMFVKLPGDSK